MLLKTFRVRCIADDMPAHYSDIIANSIESAWGKFKKQKKAKAFRFGILEPLPQDYDIRLESFKSV